MVKDLLAHRVWLGVAMTFCLLAVGCASESDSAPSGLLAPAASVSGPKLAPSAGHLCGATSLPVGAFLDVGHRDVVHTIARVGGRIVSEERSMQGRTRWILWDADKGESLASGKGPTPAPELAGTTMMEWLPDEVVLRDARDGRERTRIPIDRQFGSPAVGLSRDGRYVYLAGTKSLRVLDLDGRLLREQPGFYPRAHIFAGTSELRVSEGPMKGIETLPLDGGERRVSPPYEGLFSNWFADGRHFVTTLATAFHVYTSEGELVRALPLHVLPPFAGAWSNGTGGMGEYVWTHTYGGTNEIATDVYHLSEPTPVLSFRGVPLPGDGRMTRFAFVLPSKREDWTTVRLLDLRGPSPTWRDLEVPQLDVRSLSIDEQDHWAVGGPGGVVHRSQNDSVAALGCGEVVSLAASSSANRFVIATEDRNVRVFEVDEQIRLIHTLSPPRLGYRARVELAASGRFLIVKLLGEIRGFSLEGAPSELVWEAGRVLGIDDVAGAAQAERIAVSTCSAPLSWRDCSVAVQDLTGRVLWRTSKVEDVDSFRLSPDGEKLALAREWTVPSTSPAAPLHETLIYDRERQIGKVGRTLEAWIDADRLMLDFAEIIDVREQPITARDDFFSQVRCAPFYSDDPEYFYCRGDVYRTGDKKRVWSPLDYFHDLGLGASDAVRDDDTLMGQATLGNRVVLGSETCLYLGELKRER